MTKKTRMFIKELKSIGLVDYPANAEAEIVLFKGRSADELADLVRRYITDPAGVDAQTIRRLLHLLGRAGIANLLNTEESKMASNKTVRDLCWQAIVSAGEEVRKGQPALSPAAARQHFVKKTDTGRELAEMMRGPGADLPLRQWATKRREQAHLESLGAASWGAVCSAIAHDISKSEGCDIRAAWQRVRDLAPGTYRRYEAERGRA